MSYEHKPLLDCMAAINDAVNKFVGWALIALVVLVLEMRLEVGKQEENIRHMAIELDRISDIAVEVQKEQVRREAIIEWVKEFRNAMGWNGSDKKYLGEIKKEQHQ